MRPAKLLREKGEGDAPSRTTEHGPRTTKTTNDRRVVIRDPWSVFRGTANPRYPGTVQNQQPPATGAQPPEALRFAGLLLSGIGGLLACIALLFGWDDPGAWTARLGMVGAGLVLLLGGLLFGRRKRAGLYIAVAVSFLLLAWFLRDLVQGTARIPDLATLLFCALTLYVSWAHRAWFSR